ncbi:hypothetical protein BU23DRAFT_260869 [Bimuria novae-zelandiae CBS 107.79]|uniref:Uncharacterized protein n=1 Tax=Bimuria novae-zelandiae CBS 107.79 TaxID=1447943 RepID=A0A6A5UTI4_9PLEO|nr:hypothetical protein BU23DRAFT_260869 [Bimuria novae-zelandiae CBS 107.79]
MPCVSMESPYWLCLRLCPPQEKPLASSIHGSKCKEPLRWNPRTSPPPSPAEPTPRCRLLGSASKPSNLWTLLAEKRSGYQAFDSTPGSRITINGYFHLQEPTQHMRSVVGGSRGQACCP